MDTSPLNEVGSGQRDWHRPGSNVKGCQRDQRGKFFFWGSNYSLIQTREKGSPKTRGGLRSLVFVRVVLVLAVLDLGLSLRSES